MRRLLVREGKAESKTKPANAKRAAAALERKREIDRASKKRSRAAKKAAKQAAAAQ